MLQIKSKYKLAKRLGAAIFEQTQTQKFSLSEARSRKDRRKRPKAMSDYGKQLLEKQKVRYTYGLSEKQFRGYVSEAMETPDPAASLHRFLESRLDNVAYRLGLASTRRAARQMVSHGHLLVNGNRMTVPSHRMRAGDEISVRESSRDSVLFSHLRSEGGLGTLPAWLTFDANAFSGKVVGEPAHSAGDALLDYSAVLEYYSR